MRTANKQVTLISLRHGAAAALAIVLACGGAFAGPAGGAYYVAIDGNDANPGTRAAPFRSIQKGVTAARPGDTVLVRGAPTANLSASGPLRASAARARPCPMGSRTPPSP